MLKNEQIVDFSSAKVPVLNFFIAVVFTKLYKYVIMKVWRSLMLVDISVKNFRSVKEKQTLTFEALRDNRLDDSRVVSVDEKTKLIKTVAIVGPNGAGKSTIVRAIEAVKAILTAKEEEENPLRSLIGNSFAYGETKGKPSEISITFVINGKITYYTIVADMHRIYSESLFQKIDGLRRKLFVRTYLAEEDKYKLNFGKYYVGEKRKATHKLKANRAFLQVAAQKSTIEEGDVNKEALSWFTNVLDVKPVGFAQGSEMFLVDMLTKHPDWGKKIVDFLWSCDITDVKEIGVQGGHPIFVHANVSQKYGAFFSGESLSLRRLSTIAASYFEAFTKNKVMFFDDFGMMLHPSVVSHAAELFEGADNVKNSQLIVVDCNPSLLKNNLLRRDGIYFAEKQNDSSTHYYSLADFKSAGNKQNVQVDYLNGAFGALPLVSDFRFDS